MKDKIVSILKIVFFFGIGIFLLWLVYRNEDLHEIWNAVKEANFLWLWVSIIIGILSHVSRALRWNILIEPLGYKPHPMNTFMAVMIMYITNLAIPRSGEVTRCGLLKRYEKVPFSKLLGTVFIERVVDFIILLILLAGVLVVEFSTIIDFFQENVSNGIINILTSTYFIIGSFLAIAIAGTVIYVFRKKFQHTALYQKAHSTFISFLDGIKTIQKMDKKWAFMAHSIFIYIMYFSMIYVCFFAFEFTEHLTLTAGMSIFVLSSLGMVAPAPGGIGTWHFMAIGTLLIYGIPATQAKVFAIAAHSTMTLMIAIVGFICFVYLPIFNKSRDKTEKPKAYKN